MQQYQHKKENNKRSSKKINHALNNVEEAQTIMKKTTGIKNDYPFKWVNEVYLNFNLAIRNTGKNKPAR